MVADIRLEWLAAVLRPEDVVPHRLFVDPEYDDLPHVRLAAAVINRQLPLWTSFEKEPEPVPYDELSPEYQLTELAVQTLDPATMRDAAFALRDRVLGDRNTDVATIGSMALMAANALGSLEEIESCERVLNAVLEKVAAAAPNPARTLLRCAVLQQLSLRKRDWGSTDTSLSFEVNRLLATLDPRQFPDFQLSPAATGDAQTVVRHIMSGLQHAAWTVLPTENSWTVERPEHEFDVRDFVKAPRSEQLLIMREDQSEQYEDYIRETFRGKYNDRSFTPGHSSVDLYFVNLRNELYGTGLVRETRRSLALLRLVQAANGDRLVDRGECIRLLRYSNADSELQLALARIRLVGPLDGLSKQARQVIARRLTPDRVSRSDLRVLAAAADLVTNVEARTAVSALNDLVDQGSPLNDPGHWTAHFQRLEEMLSAAAPLANTAGVLSDFSVVLLKSIQSSRFDEALDMAYARTINTFALDEISADAKTEWRRWLEATGSWAHTSSIVRLKLGIQSAHHDFTVRDITDAQAVILDAKAGVLVPPDALVIAAAIVDEAMGQIRTWAHASRFASGGIAPAPLAVLLIELGVEPIWDALSDFLNDDAVARQHKDSAFDRLLSADVELPHKVAEYYRAHGPTLLGLGATPSFEVEICAPHPALLRFLGFHGLIGAPELLAGVSQLAGSSSPHCRAEAAKTIAMLCQQGPTSWMMALALQLSFDTAGDAQAYATNALALMANDATGNAGFQRLTELMASDGLIAPLLAVRGIAKGTARFNPSIRRELQKLAGSHPSRQVRVEAEKALNQPTSPAN